MSVQRRIEQAVRGGERAAVLTVIGGDVAAAGTRVGAKLFALEGGG